MLIVAGPGSGKTRAITYRIAYLVRVLGVSPRRILAVTFTNKAAREMRSRVEALLGDRANELTVGTFHNFGARILRAHGEGIGIPRDFVIYDADDQKTLVRRALEEVGLDPKRYTPSAVQNGISGAKNQLLTVRDHLAQKANYFDEIVNRVYEKYDALLRENHAVDFDDLLLQPVLLFQKQPEVLKRYQDRYLHVMVDEWQDTNRAQYLLTKQMAGQHRNLCVVGDPDQSIYSWRHADIRNIMDFEKDFPDAKSIILGRNYRSTETILEAAHKVIVANRQRKDVQLWTDKGAGQLLTVSEAYNEQEEALYVASEVERLVQQKDAHYGDMAIMYRTNAQSRAPEEAFVRAGIPYRIIGGLRFWERREVKDVMGYLRVIHNPYDSVSLTRIINVPTRGIGARTIESLTQWSVTYGLPLHTAMQMAVAPLEDSEEGNGAAVPRPTVPKQAEGPLRIFVETLNTLMDYAKEMDVVTFFDQVVTKTGYRDFVQSEEDGEERWDNLLELRAAAAEYRDLSAGDGLTVFLETAALSSDLDQMAEEGPDAVTLITLHQAKGLEFPTVFMVGMEEGLLPHRRSLDSGDSAELEEERRLCYVGMTRAKERLYLTLASHRPFAGGFGGRGGGGGGGPSRFLRDIPQNLVHASAESSILSSATARDLGASEARMPKGPADDDASKGPVPFKPGDHVGHLTFGEGVVVACLATAQGDDYEVTVAFKGQGVKRLLTSLAMLEKLG